MGGGVPTDLGGGFINGLVSSPKICLYLVGWVSLETGKTTRMYGCLGLVAGFSLAAGSFLLMLDEYLEENGELSCR